MTNTQDDRQPAMPTPESELIEEDPRMLVEPAVSEPLNTSAPDFSGEPAQGSPLLDAVPVESTMPGDFSTGAGFGAVQVDPAMEHEGGTGNSDLARAWTDEGHNRRTDLDETVK